MNWHYHLIISFVSTYILTIILGSTFSQAFYLAIIGGLLGILIDFDHLIAVTIYPGGLREITNTLGRGDVVAVYVILCGSDGVIRFPLYHIIHPIILGVGFALWISFMPLPLMHCALVLPIHFLCDFWGTSLWTSTMAYLGGFSLVLSINIILGTFL